MSIADSAPPWRIRALRTVVRGMPRGRYRLLSAIAPTRGRFTARLAADAGGAHFACDLSDQICREVCLTGLYEPPVTRVVQRHLATAGAAVDLGANWGYFSLLAGAAAGSSGRVLALEPDPRQFAALSRNLDVNAFHHVSAVQAAASAEEGRVTLVGYDEGQTNRGVSRLGPSTQGANHFDVRSVPLDALTADWPHVDLVKIDVEGAEDVVLHGMRDGLAARRYRAIVLELHPELLQRKGVDPASCISRLRDAGYEGWTIDLGAEAYRRAIDARVPVDSLLLPLDRWRETAWPHLLWLS